MVMKRIFGSMLENIVNSFRPKNVIFVQQPLYMQHNTNLNNSHLTIDGHVRTNNELQSYNQPDLAPHLSPSPGTYGATINDNINNSVKPVDYGIQNNQDLLKNNSIVDQPNIINNDNFQSPVNHYNAINDLKPISSDFSENNFIPWKEEKPNNFLEENDSFNDKFLIPEIKIPEIKIPEIKPIDHDFSSLSAYSNNKSEDPYDYNNRMSENDKPLFGYNLSPKNYDIHFHGRNENEITHAHYKEHATHKRFGYLNGYEAAMEDHNLFEEEKERYNMHKPIRINPPKINPIRINPPNINPIEINPPEIKNSLFYSNNNLYNQITNDYDDD